MAVFGSKKRELTLNAGFSKIFVRKISTIVTDPDKKKIQNLRTLFTPTCYTRINTLKNKNKHLELHIHIHYQSDTVFVDNDSICP